VLTAIVSEMQARSLDWFLSELIVRNARNLVCGWAHKTM